MQYVIGSEWRKFTVCSHVTAYEIKACAVKRIKKRRPVNRNHSAVKIVPHERPAIAHLAYTIKNALFGHSRQLNHYKDSTRCFLKQVFPQLMR